MKVEAQIEAYLSNQSEAKSVELVELHRMIQEAQLGCRLWYLDGKNEEGKIVSNPNIGYGFQTMTYADGKTKEFYRIGLSANTTGISVYILGIDDKHFLATTYGKKIGKARVTGYCIKFKALKYINVEVLTEAVQFGFGLG